MGRIIPDFHICFRGAGQPPTRWWSGHPITSPGIFHQYPRVVSPDQSLDHGRRPRMEPLNGSACGGLGVFRSRRRRSTCHWSRRPRYDMWIYIYIIYIWICGISWYIWRFPKSWGYPSHHPVVMVIHDDSYWNWSCLGIPHDLRNPQKRVCRCVWKQGIPLKWLFE